MEVRALQLKLRLTDLDYVTYGELSDMITERANDDYKYPEKATQADFDAF